jgi:electron transfer flavoprotein alpha subunit
MTVNKEVWILAEQIEGELEEITLDLASAGRRIADKLNDELCAVIFGEQVAGLTDNLAGYSLDRIYTINDSVLKGYTAEAYIETISNLINEETPEILLCGATLFGSDIAAGLAARLETGLAPNCTCLDVSDDGLLLGTRPVYDERLQVVVVCPVGRPQIATVRPGIEDIKPPRAGCKAKVIAIDPQPSPAVTQARVTGYTKADLKTIRLDEADTIVAGGRGIGGPEGFRILEELAELLGGCVGASLVATDNGWVSDDKHIGQTGVIVAPRLYMAVGISGSIYHTMGMKDSKVIVVINRDRNAPIFSLADMGIIGDWKEVVSATISCLGETDEAPDTKI